MVPKIGFMQGRLCDPVGSKIQAFPWDQWKTEFEVSRELDIRLMEWTLDQDNLYGNPLMTSSGKREIADLCRKYNVEVPSVTGDCFMQAPFWGTSDAEKKHKLKEDFIAVCDASSEIGIKFIIVPLVDAGALESQAQEDELVDFLRGNLSLFQKINIRVIFESDYNPFELARFMERLPEEVFGVNYDIGNSAALDFDPREEFAAYGPRILNIHVKDRILGGTTVPLGCGNAKFGVVFNEIRKINYSGNFILQTARAEDGDHRGAIEKYKNMVEEWGD